MHPIQPDIAFIAGCVQDELSKDSRIVAAFLLGSAATGTMRPDSDIDLAILLSPGESMDAVQRVALAARLSRRCRRDVDLGILDTDNLIYAKEAYLNGICIHCRDPFQRDRFGADALGLYLELRESRHEVEHAYSLR